MTVSTLFRYLAGQRQAILKVAETRSVVWLGLLFVISAGFAREYDGEDLWHEPWHLLLPFGASLATSLLLFILLWLASNAESRQRHSFFLTYRMFLGLYWMTAALAWLYALPVERYFSAAWAVQANLWLLGIVAGWRVVLTIRVLCVVFQSTPWQAFLLVMLFADTVALVLLNLTTLPVLSIMGGIRLTESEQLIQQTAFVIGAIGALSWPIWLIGALVVVLRNRLAWNLVPHLTRDTTVSYSAWALGLMSLLVWIPVLPWTQREQQLRHAVESDLRAGHIGRALASMSIHERDDFPPHWDPPPRIGYGERRPQILGIVEAVLANDTKPWVAEVFLGKLAQSAGHGYGARAFWDRMDSDHFDRFLSVLERLPEDTPFIEEHQEALAEQLGEYSTRSNVQQARVRTLLLEK